MGPTVLFHGIVVASHSSGFRCIAAEDKLENKTCYLPSYYFCTQTLFLNYKAATN